MLTATMPTFSDVLPARVQGSVARVVGNELEVRGLRLAVGDAVTVHTSTGERPAQVVALSTEGVRTLLFGDTAGIARGDRVTARSAGFKAPVGAGMVGRVVDALGRPLDSGPAFAEELVEVDADAPDAMGRRRITEPLATGVRLIDTLTTVGRGQRVGIFAGSGVGKSTLLGMMARGTVADINVVALIGERGREVREFLEDDLGDEGRRRTITVVATSDEPPLMRLRAAAYATRIAEWFADSGSDVLLMMDSLTRLAMAQREVGLAAGEPPTARGYTPSVFSLLPRLLERTGTRPDGSITAFYTVLTEGSDMDDDPVADAARSILDGHLILDRDLLTKGQVPAIDGLRSLSRLAGKVITGEMNEAATVVRRLMAAADEVQDLVEVGAYVTGTNPLADKAIELAPMIRALLVQPRMEIADYDRSWEQIIAIARRAGGIA